MNIIAAFDPAALGVKEGELTGAVADIFEWISPCCGASGEKVLLELQKKVQGVVDTLMGLQGNERWRRSAAEDSSTAPQLALKKSECRPPPAGPEKNHFDP